MRRQPHRRFAQRANRYIGMLHDCLHTRQIYNTGDGIGTLAATGQSGRILTLEPCDVCW